MVFSSLLFLFAYLPLALASYYCLPRKYRNAALFLLSLLFYAWGEPIYPVVMLLSLTAAYFFGFPIARRRVTEKRSARAMTVLSVALTLSFLFFFKYYNFFAVNLSRLPFLELPPIDGLRLPIGISFYTFQIISYTVDLYRGDCELQKNYISFGCYVTLFPQLIAGPIVRYREIDGQLAARRETVKDFSEGALRFSAGLAKKVLLGDTLAAAYVYFRDTGSLFATVLGAWSAAILYALHLYYDFSGYSDLAVGLGRMLGFSFPENFRYPYISRSIGEFWRRWHISLSTWFREYVYIPLGGNRVGKRKLYRNLAVVWLLTGFWHGAAWNFLLWGAYFAVILILERAFLLRFLERLPRSLQHLYAVFLIVIGFVIFSSPTLTEAGKGMLSLFGVGTAAFCDRLTFYRLLRLVPLLLLSFAGATPGPRMLWDKARTRYPIAEALRPILCGLSLCLSVAYLVSAGFSPFEYTQF